MQTSARDEPADDPTSSERSGRAVAGAEADKSARRGAAWRLHRRLYDWVLRWAETPHGAIALFALAFMESSFFPVPPDVLLIALVIGSPRRWLRFAAICTAGSVLGGVAGYGIGLGLMESVGRPILRWYGAEEQFARVQSLYEQYDYWIVFAAAFTPIPYKVFTIASGAFGMNVAGFVLVSLVGRGARFFAVSGLLRLFGQPLRRFLERYFDLLSLAFVALLILGFVYVKWLAS